MNVSRTIRYCQGGAGGAQELDALEQATGSASSEMAGGGAADYGSAVCADALGRARSPKQRHHTQ